MVQLRTEVVGLDASILSSPKDLGSLWPPQEFHRPARRLPHVQAALASGPASRRQTTASSSAPTAEARISLTPGRSTSCSRRSSARSKTRGRWPTCARETGQGHFVNFLPMSSQTEHLKPPFGTAQVGKSFRNENHSGASFVFRTREFEQMELEYYVTRPTTPSDGSSTGATSATSVVRAPRHTMREMLAAFAIHSKEELLALFRRGRPMSSSPSRAQGWGELEGIANRTDFDLKAHSAAKVARRSSISTPAPVSATCLQVEISPVGNALESSPSPKGRRTRLGRPRRIMRQFLFAVVAKAQHLTRYAEARTTRNARCTSTRTIAGRRPGWDVVLGLHLLELPRRKTKLPGVISLRNDLPTGHS